MAHSVKPLALSSKPVVLWVRIPWGSTLRMYCNIVLFWLVSSTDQHFYIVNCSFSHLTHSTITCQTSIWVAHSVKPLCLNVAGRGLESSWRMSGLKAVLWSEAARTLLLFQMTDLSCAFVLNLETYVCSFSSELLFSFELLNLYVFSMYALFLPFCSSRSAPPFLLFPGLAPVIAACSYIGSYSC